MTGRQLGLAASLLALLSSGTLAQPRAPLEGRGPRVPQDTEAVRSLLDLSYLASPNLAADLPSGAPHGRREARWPSSERDPMRMLDLYLPKESQPAPPLFVYLHGGAWVSGDKRQYGALGLALAAQGVAVAILNYRLSSSGADGVRHPVHAHDAALAISWLRKQAPRYGYDAARIFIGGHSAGAHLAAMLAYDTGLLSAAGERADALRGYVGFAGIYDLNELVRRFPSYRVEFLQLAFGADETTWRMASPQHLLATGAVPHKRPWLLLHSREDELVDIEQSRRFQKALEKQGIVVRWLPLERVSHFGVIGELSIPHSPLCQQLLAFLKG